MVIVSGYGGTQGNNAVEGRDTQTISISILWLLHLHRRYIN